MEYSKLNNMELVRQLEGVKKGAMKLEDQVNRLTIDTHFYQNTINRLQRDNSRLVYENYTLKKERAELINEVSSMRSKSSERRSDTK